jgi:hypothetical protein
MTGAANAPEATNSHAAVNQDDLRIEPLLSEPVA